MNREERVDINRDAERDLRITRLEAELLGLREAVQRLAALLEASGLHAGGGDQYSDRHGSEGVHGA